MAAEDGLQPPPPTADELMELLPERWRAPSRTVDVDALPVWVTAFAAYSRLRYDSDNKQESDAVSAARIGLRPYPGSDDSGVVDAYLSSNAEALARFDQGIAAGAVMWPWPPPSRDDDASHVREFMQMKVMIAKRAIRDGDESTAMAQISGVARLGAMCIDASRSAMQCLVADSILAEAAVLTHLALPLLSEDDLRALTKILTPPATLGPFKAWRSGMTALTADTAKIAASDGAAFAKSMLMTERIGTVVTTMALAKDDELDMTEPVDPVLFQRIAERKTSVDGRQMMRDIARCLSLLDGVVESDWPVVKRRLRDVVDYAVSPAQRNAIDLLSAGKDPGDDPVSSDILTREDAATLLWEAMVLPSLEYLAQSAVSIQAHLALARTACAIELHKRSHHALPSSLHELIDEGLLSDLPRDPFDGGLLRWDYARGRLWSIGTDGRDDGGVGDVSRPMKNKDIIWAFTTEASVSTP
ncbi:MAG: hypothetical protein H0W83_01220 [Planctomycetes bacterium]|nr:hypothetical protein [Planctomycetota bacterium]